MIKNILFLLFVIQIIVSCSKSSSSAPSTVTKPPQVVQVKGLVVNINASTDSFVIQSPTVVKEDNSTAVDGTKVVISAIDSEVSLSMDNTNFQNGIETTTKDGVFQVYAKTSTNKVGIYKLKVTIKDTNIYSYYYVNINPGKPATITDIIGTKYQDLPPYNGIKDANEKWAALIDGSSLTYLTVGNIYDQFGNTLQKGKVRLTLSDDKTIVSANPVDIIDGTAFFTVQSNLIDGPFNVTADVFDADNTTVLATKTVEMVGVKPALTISESGDIGNVFLNDSKTIVLNLSNNGNTPVKNIVYELDQPFVLNNAGSCTGKTTLNPNESCTISITFTAKQRDRFEGYLSILGAPSSVGDSKLIKKITSRGVAPATMDIADVNYDFGQKDCGTNNILDFYIKNSGDVPVENISIVQPTIVDAGLAVSPINIVIPPLDPNASNNVDDIIDCGNNIPEGRKCHFQLVYNPTKLLSYKGYLATIQPSNSYLRGINLVAKAGSVTGKPFGPLAIKLFNPDILPVSETTGIDISSAYRVNAVVNNIHDRCGNTVLDGIPVNATITKGSMGLKQKQTVNGSVSFEWRGSDILEDVGVQTINISSYDAAGSANLKFNGIKLRVEGLDDLGQVLTVDPHTLYYTIRNEGTIPANALNISLDFNNTQGVWGIIDNHYAGGCEDHQLLAGESCQIKLVVNTSLFGVGPFEGNIVANSTEQGLNFVSKKISGHSELPPVFKFDQTNYDFGGLPAKQTLYTKTLTLTNIGPATATNLKMNITAPYTIKSTTCPTDSFSGILNNTCQIVVELSTNQLGTYTGSLTVSADFYTITTNFNAILNPALAAGDIPITVDKTSVPADRISVINFTFGPIKDDLGNTVKDGVPVTITHDGGQFNLDPSVSGKFIAYTNTSGVVVGTFKSRALTEVKTVNIKAEVIDSGISVASGTTSVKISGAILNIQESNIDFGNTILGVPIVKTATIKNEGDQRISNLVFNMAGNDVVISNYGSCALPNNFLDAGSTCQITLTYNPVILGALNAKLTVSGTGTGQLADILSFSGNALMPAHITISPTSLESNISPGGSLTGTLILTNDGDEAINSVSFSISKNPEYFIINSSTCLSIAAKGSCAVSYAITPTNLSAGDFLSTISFSGISPTRTVTSLLNVIIHPSTFAFNLDVPKLYADECTSFSLKTIKANGDAVVSLINLPVNLTASNTGTFYNSSDCTGAAITSTQVSVGTSIKTGLSFKPSQTGNYTLYASNNLLQTGQILLLSAKLNLLLTSANSDLFTNVGNCESFTLSLVTPDGTLYPSKSIFAATINQSLSGEYYLDNTCSTNKVTNSYVNFSIGQSAMSLYWKPLVKGANVLSFTNPNKTNNSIAYNIVNLPSLNVNSNTSFDCGGSSCPNPISSDGSYVYPNSVARRVTSNISIGDTTINIDSNGLSVGDLLIIKSQPFSESDFASMKNYQYFRVTAINSSTQIKVANLVDGTGSSLSFSSPSNIIGFKIPEFYNMYLKNGASMYVPAINFSNGVGGFLGVAVYNHLVGQSSTPVNPDTQRNGLTYGDGITIYVDSSNNMFLQGGGLTCSAGYTAVGTSCLVSNVSQPCTISHGIGTQASTDAGQTWGSCTVSSCDNGYTSVGNSCLVSNVSQSCTISHGTGTQTSTDAGQTWSVCVASSCDNGYTVQGGSCVAITPNVSCFYFNSYTNFYVCTPYTTYNVAYMNVNSSGFISSSKVNLNCSGMPAFSVGQPNSSNPYGTAPDAYSLFDFRANNSSGAYINVYNDSGFAIGYNGSTLIETPAIFGGNATSAASGTCTQL